MVITISVIKYKEDKKIILILDQDELDEYLEGYFREHPRRRKKPVENPVHPSINVWTGKHYQQRNNMKQGWNDFILWFIDKYKLGGYGITKCNVHCHLVFPTKHRRDPDNYTHKFINDGLVESGFMVDDSFKQILVSSYSSSYEKGNYRTEITVDIVEMNGEFI